MLAQVRHPLSELRPQLQLSTTISTIKPSCCRPTCARSTTSKRSAHYRSHLPPQPNPHSGGRGILRASPPRVPSLAAFGRRPPVDVARLSQAGIRNPAQRRKHRPLDERPAGCKMTPTPLTDTRHYGILNSGPGWWGSDVIQSIETTRLHHDSRRCGGLAGCGPCAAAWATETGRCTGPFAGDRVCSIFQRASPTWFHRGSKSCH
jgi:hypothetical protein